MELDLQVEGSGSEVGPCGPAGASLVGRPRHRLRSSRRLFEAASYMG